VGVPSYGRDYARFGAAAKLPKEDKALGTSAFRWHRIVAIGMTIVFAYYCAYGVWRTIYETPALDFVSYWSAGKLALTGSPGGSYDNAAHSAVELTVSSLEGSIQPFPYPPPFLLFVTPFALLLFPVAFAAWLFLTAALFFVAFRRIAPPPYTFALPAAHGNALVGQNGFLTAGVFALGTALLDTQPFLAGTILGVLVIKPQLALMLPVAVIAGRKWRAIGGAIISASALLLAALLAFGPSTYAAFYAYLPTQTHQVSTGVPLYKLASICATMLFFGAPMVVALAVQGVVTLAVAVATWVAWSRDLPTKVPILAAATMLAPPYLFGYDALLLLLPLGWLIRHERQPVTVAMIWLLCLLPLAAGTSLYPGPNTIPLAAALAIWAMFREARADPAETQDWSARPQGTRAQPVP
jgi:hypothetical protein